MAYVRFPGRTSANALSLGRDAGGYNYEYTRGNGTDSALEPKTPLDNGTASAPSMGSLLPTLRLQSIPADLAFPIGIVASLVISLLLLLRTIAQRLQVTPSAYRLALHPSGRAVLLSPFGRAVCDVHAMNCISRKLLLYCSEIALNDQFLS